MPDMSGNLPPLRSSLCIRPFPEAGFLDQYILVSSFFFLLILLIFELIFHLFNALLQLYCIRSLLSFRLFSRSWD